MCHRNKLILMDIRLDTLPALAAIYLPLLLAVAACATTPSGNKDLLTFLNHDPVTKQEVLAHLGEASATFEKNRVLTYRLRCDKGGFSIQPTTSRYVAYHNAGWEGVDYELVLVFDENGVLQRHNLVSIRPP
jgi:hypothetical protein